MAVDDAEYRAEEALCRKGAVRNLLSSARVEVRSPKRAFSVGDEKMTIAQLWREAQMQERLIV